MRHNTFLARRARHYVERIIALSYVELAFWYTVMVASCAALYTFLFNVAPEHAPTLAKGGVLMEFLEASYFSIMTATSVGYGDIVPQGISKLFATLEAIIGLSLFAVLISKPIAEQQQRTILKTHKLSLDEMLTTIREGFFIMRKDFDKVIEEAERGRLSEHRLENFVVALEQGQILMDNIPTFYETDMSISGLDEKREMLLAEAVERTFDRLFRLLTLLDDRNLHWRGRREAVQALNELLTVTERVLPKWKIGTSESAGVKLRGIEQLVESLRAFLNR